MKNTFSKSRVAGLDHLRAGLHGLRRHRPLRIEPLEERRLLSVDLFMDTFYTYPDSASVEERLDLHVDYEIYNATANAFDIGIYSSVDGVTPGTLLMTHSVTGDGLLADTHTAVFKANFEDAPFDYYLMAKLDSYDAVVETDEDNNLAKFDGGTFMGADRTTNVVGRYVSYNDSAFDGGNAAANAADDDAIAPDKFPLLPGTNATYRNVTSYEKGINGVIIDIWNLPTQQLDIRNDFDFNRFSGGFWLSAPDPDSFDVEELEDGVSRVRLAWNTSPPPVTDNWLQVTVKNTDNTGLDHPDVFYFGNLVGEVDQIIDNGQWKVTGLEPEVENGDYDLVVANSTASATIENLYDLDRDGDVDGDDVSIVGANNGTELMVLTPPGPAYSPGILQVHGYGGVELRRAPGLWRGVAYREAFGAKRPLFTLNLLYLAA